MILFDSAPVLALGAETYARASPENQGAWKYQSFYVKDIFANIFEKTSQELRMLS